VSTTLPPLTPPAASAALAAAARAPGRPAPHTPAARAARAVRAAAGVARAPFRTVRARLVGGFGATLILLAAAGALGVAALQSVGTRAADTVAALQSHHDTVQQVGAAVLREIVAGTRAADSDAEVDARRYQQAMDEADALRRDAVALPGLADAERERLEAVGQLQAAVEARLAMVRAYRAVGRPDDARAALARLAADVTGSSRRSAGCAPRPPCAPPSARPR
jgi:hypothetical protein